MAYTFLRLLISLGKEFQAEVLTFHLHAVKEGVFAVLWRVFLEDISQSFDLVLILLLGSWCTHLWVLLKLRKLLLEESKASLTPVTPRVDISVFLSSAGLVGREEGRLDSKLEKGQRVFGPVGL